jgi:phage FluMu protein Com
VVRITPRKGIEEITKPSDIDVKDHEIRWYSNSKGARIALDRRHGEGNWGPEEVKAYIQERRFEEYTKPKKPAPREASPVEERLAAYLEEFDVVTPNDEEMLKAMAEIEVNLEAIGKLLIGEKSPTEIRKLTESKTKLLTEHRQLQTILGIDRAGREKSKKQKSAVDEIQELVEGGARFIEEQLVKISHCGIEMGWLLYHFSESGYEFRAKCPRCGGQVQICTSKEERDDALELFAG